MDLETVRISFHKQFLNYRNVDKLILTDNFSIAYGKATNKEKVAVTIAIDRADKKVIQKFVLQQLQKMTPFHRLGIKALRAIGKNISLPKYHTLSKSSLIEEIQDVAARLKKDSE